MKEDGRKKVLEELYTLKFGKKMTMRKILYHFYVDQDMSIRALAREFHCSQGTISNWLRQYGISGKRYVHPDRVIKNTEVHH